MAVPERLPYEPPPTELPGSVVEIWKYRPELSGVPVVANGMRGTEIREKDAVCALGEVFKSGAASHAIVELNDYKWKGVLLVRSDGQFTGFSLRQGMMGYSFHHIEGAMPEEELDALSLTPHTPYTRSPEFGQNNTPDRTMVRGILLVNGETADGNEGIAESEIQREYDLLDKSYQEHASLAQRRALPW